MINFSIVSEMLKEIIFFIISLLNESFFPENCEDFPTLSPRSEMSTATATAERGTAESFPRGRRSRGRPRLCFHTNCDILVAL